MSTTTSPTASDSPPLRAVLRENLVAALVLWAFAGGLVAAYYGHAGARAALDALARLKAEAGLVLVMSAQAVAGGLVPWTLRRLGGSRADGWRALIWLLALWAVQGAMTDRFYGLQARLFGDAPELRIMALKTTFDMLVYTPLVCLPWLVLGLAFKDNGFDLGATRRALGPGWFWRRVPPLYRASLLVWTPAVALLYLLPLPLQFPVQAVVQCFFALLAVGLTRPAAERGAGKKSP